MPEAIAVVIVVAISVAIYMFAWIRARDPAHFRIDDEIDRVRVKRAALEERLEKAKREEWSPDMQASLAEQLEATLREAEKLALDKAEETT